MKTRNSSKSINPYDFGKSLQRIIVKRAHQRTIRHVSVGRLFIFSLIPLIVVLAFGEVSVRIWAAYFRTSYERLNYATGVLELVPNTHFTSAEGREILINSKGFVGPEFELKKQEGTYRIFALGDSCTFGGSWNEAYPAELQRLIDSLGLDRRVEVINAGVEGYNSEYAFARLKNELLVYSPDMVIVYIGWNDLMKVNPNNLSSTGRYTWVARLLDRSYLVKGLSKIIFFYLRPAIVSPDVDGDLENPAAFEQFVPSAYKDNLLSIVDLLTEKGIFAILVTLPTAVHEHLSPQDLKERNIFFPYYAGAYGVNKFLSLHRSYNMAVRSVAVERQVRLVDLDLIFEGYDKKGLFWDTMHPSKEGQTLVARSLFEEIVGELVVVPSRADR
jgi:lysophospholipase L1-like esterase